MSKTRHIQRRMSQRGINNELLELTQKFGKTVERGDVAKTVLNCKGIDKALNKLDAIRKKLTQARDKGGVVLVSSSEGTQITTYRLDSFERGRTS